MRVALGCLLTLCVIGLASGSVRRLGVSSIDLSPALAALEAVDPPSLPAFELPVPVHSSPDRPLGVDLREVEEEDSDGSKHLAAVLMTPTDRPFPPTTSRLLARFVGIDGFRTSIRSQLLRC